MKMIDDLFRALPDTVVATPEFLQEGMRGKDGSRKQGSNCKLQSIQKC